MNRVSYLNTVKKYLWILSVIRGNEFNSQVIEYDISKMDDAYLHMYVYGVYCELKVELSLALYNRLSKYEKNKLAHVIQKTSEKQFYRFLQATGYCFDVQCLSLPIGRLIQIYTVYFQDLQSFKSSLDKKNVSPYIS